MKNKKIKEWQKRWKILLFMLLMIFVLPFTLPIKVQAAKSATEAAKKSKEEVTMLLPVAEDGGLSTVGHLQYNYTGNYNYFSDMSVHATDSSKSFEANVHRNTALGKQYTNSSKGTLRKSSNDARIVKAYLFWETRKPYNKDDKKANHVTLVGKDKKTSQDVYPDYAFHDNRYWSAWGNAHRVYNMVADVSDFVKKQGYGNYYVANIPEHHDLDAGGDNICSWQLVVIEEDPDLPIRALSLKAGATWRFGDWNYDSQLGYTHPSTTLNDEKHYNKLTSSVTFSQGITTKKTGTVSGQILIGMANDHDMHEDAALTMKDYLFTQKDKKASKHFKDGKLSKIKKGGLYKNGSKSVSEYGLIVSLEDIDDLGRAARGANTVGVQVQDFYWNTFIYIGSAVDIEVVDFFANQHTIIDPNDSNKVTITGAFSNCSADENTGIYNTDANNSKIVVNIDPQLTVTSATCTKADGKKLSSGNIEIDNANHTVTFKKLKCIKRGESISYSITCTASAGSITYHNSDYISGNLYSSGVKTGMYIDRIASGSSSAKRDNGKFGIYLHPNSPREDGYVAQWYMSGNWCHNNTNWSAGKAENGTTYAMLYHPYMYKQYTLGKSYTLPQSGNILIPGYHTAAAGWYTAPDGGDYIPNGAVDLNNLVNYVGADGAVHLYAHWVGAPHTLTFDANGGTVGTASVPIRYGTGDYCDVSWNTPVRAGYTFLGWYTAAVDGTQVYSAAGQCSNEGTYWSDNLCVYNGDYTVYAHWEANVYHIRFNGNGATEGITADMTCNYGQDYNLNANGFKRTGYTFTGWNTQANGTGTTYTDKQSIRDAGDMTLYAQWKINTYKVILHAGNGIESVSGAGTYTYGATVTIEVAVKPGYHWKDWTGTYQTAEQKYSFTMPAKDVEMTAYADANEYTIRFDPNTGAEKTHIDDITVKYDELVTLPNGGESYVKYTLDGVNITEQIMTGAIVIDINGNVIREGEPLPEGCEVAEDGTITYPDGTTHKPDGTVISADGIITSPDGIITYPDGTVTYPDGTTRKPDGSVVTADGTTTTADGTIIAPNGIVTKPDGTVIYPDGNIVLPNGSTQNAIESAETSKHDTESESIDKLEDSIGEEKENEKKADSTEKTDKSAIKKADSKKEKVVSIEKKAISIVKEPQIQESDSGIEVKTDGVAGENQVEQNMRGATAQSLEPETEPQPDKKAYESVYMGWSLEDGKESFIPQWKALEEMSVNDIVAAAGVTEQNGAIITLYANWDDCPWITATNLYYTLAQAQTGFITVDEILSHASAADREDGTPIAPGVHANGTSFTIPDYQESEFSNLLHEGSVTENLTVVDSVGSKYVKQITVYIVDTTSVEVQPKGYTRFINEKYYNSTFEHGGLEDNSIWKTDAEYRGALLKAFDNMKNDMPMMIFEYTHEDIEAMKAYVEEHGACNSRESSALEGFYNQFMAPNRIK